MMEARIRGPALIRGEARVPGDKSISHRALILGAMAKGEMEIRGLSPARDVRSTAECLRALGVELSLEEEKALVHGRGPESFSPPLKPLDCGNSGTTMRLLAGVLAGRPFESVLVGDESLSRRPMRRVVEPLSLMGAEIHAREGNLPPLRVRGGRLRGIHYRLPVASAQVKSAIMLAGLQAEGETVVEEPLPSRDHTERMLLFFGAQLEKDGTRIRLVPGELRARPVAVAGDFSSAAFLLAAAAPRPGAEVLVHSVGVNPTRTGFLEVLREMGADVAVLGRDEIAGEPVADIRVRGRELRGIELGGEIVPRMIDEIPLVFVLATQAAGTTVVRGARELRVKESDRISAMAENLRRLGAEVRELPDGMEIRGPRRLRAARLLGFMDHRVVMACAVAALFAEGESVIEGAEWAEVSFPGFFSVLEGIVHDR